MAGTFRVDEYRGFVNDNSVCNIYIVFKWDPKVLGSRVYAVLWARVIVVLWDLALGRFYGCLCWAFNGLTVSPTKQWAPLLG